VTEQRAQSIILAMIVVIIAVLFLYVSLSAPPSTKNVPTTPAITATP
jgi:cytochrome oxidase Cu insertion factor (SCO1/SenC/PrrC family)